MVPEQRRPSDRFLGATYYLQSGLFYFGHNFTVSGAANIDGSSGVLLYFNGGGMTLSAGGSVTLSPMSWGSAPTGPQSMAIWQASSDQSNLTLSAGGGLNITSGIIYVPNTSAQVNLSNAGATTAQLGSAVKSLPVCCSSAAPAISTSTSGPAAAPGRQLFLVE